MGLSFTIAAGPRQRSHSQVRVPPHFTASDSRLPQPGGPGLRIYIHQEEGDSVISPGTVFVSFVWVLYYDRRAVGQSVLE
jgi:hypothetical protein